MLVRIRKSFLLLPAYAAEDFKVCAYAAGNMAAELNTTLATKMLTSDRHNR